MEDAEKTAASAGNSAASAQRTVEETPRLMPSADVKAVERACNGICAHSRELRCSHMSECFANCLGMGTITPCSDEVARFYRCLAKQPTANWQCDEDGVAAIRESFCDDEQAGVVRCMQQKAR